MTEDDEIPPTPDDENDAPSRRRAGRPSPAETERLAAVAFGGAPSGGGQKIPQFGCPQCGAMVSAANADADGRFTCGHCNAEVIVPEGAAHDAGELNEGMRPASLPSKKEPRPVPNIRADDPDLEEEVRNRLKRDSQHRLSPQLTPKLQPIDEVRATAQGSRDNWVLDESKYTGHASGSRRVFGLFRILLILALLGGGLWFLFNLKQKKEKPETDNSPVTALQEDIDSALQNFEHFKEMLDMNQRALFTRHKEITLPRMLKYYERRGINPPVASPRPFTAKESTRGGKQFLEFESDLRGHPVTVYFEKTPEGDYVVDWESLVGYNDMDWDMFIIREPAEATDFRVYAKWGDYYKHEFSDPATHRSIILTHVESPNELYAYVPVNSDLEKKAILILDQEKSKAVPCMVRVRLSNPGSQHRQAVIESIQEGWLVP